MACIDKLIFRGIRSFGPFEQDEAKLKFSSPLTIILGKNGCGKTTIIEALKYATCGEMPGNCSLGAGFVHDPKLCDLIETWAQVKLQVRDVKGELVQVSRSMKTVQLAKRLQFKTMDQTITRKDQTGQDVSISGRCADIDAEMCVAMGVSKAILNSVVFCHQEDSNWPLDEGKKLKERFDLIFDTAKYNKCLDSIKNQRKDLSADISNQRKDVELLEVRKTEAADKKRKLSEEESRMSAIQDKVTEYEHELGPIKRRMGELINREMDISRLITERAKKTATLEAIQSNILEYQDGITLEFQGSLDELKQEIHNFSTQFSHQESKLQGLEGELSRKDKEEQQLTKQLTSEQILLGQLTRDQEQNCERMEQRNKALSDLSDQLSLSSNVLTEGDVVRSLGSVERAIKEAETEVLNIQKSGEDDEKKLQLKIDELRDEKSKLEQTSQLKNQQIRTNEQETRKLKLEIDEVNQSTEKLDRLQKDLERVQKLADDLSKALDPDQMDQDIKDSETRRDKLEDELAALDKEVRELQSVSQLQTELNIQNEAKSLKEAEIRKLKNKTEDSLMHLLVNIPETGIKHQLQTCIERLGHEVRTKQSSITEKQRQLTTLETDRKHLREKLREKTRALGQDKEELYDACENREYETVLADVTNQLDIAQDEKGTLKASEIMFQRYIDKLERQSSCPICHRGFQEVHESRELITELEGRMQGMPRLIEEKERELEQLQERQSRLQQLKPTYQRINRLETEEIPALNAQLQATEVNLETTRQELQTLQTDLMSPQSDEAIAKSIQGDVALLDQHQNELRKLERQVKTLQDRLPKGGSCRDLKEALAEQDKLHKEVQQLRKSLHSLQERRNRHNQQLHKLQAEKNSIVGQQLKIQGGVQQKKQLEMKMDKLQEQEIVLLEELRYINEEIQPVNMRLEAAIRDKEQARATHKKNLDMERIRVNKLTRQCEDISKIQKSISQYEKSGGAEQLSATKQNIARLGGEKESLLENKKQLQDQINQIKVQLTNQQVRQRELDDNMKLRQKRDEENEVNAEIAQLSAKIGGMDLRKVMKEKDDLKKREETILREKAHTEGRKRELQLNIQSLREELNKDSIKNADKLYSNALIELKVKEAAHEDLGHYSKALDWAVSHFHNQRMKHINDIITDLWIQIYSGNDIDTIKIKNDEDTTSKGEKQRKVYNYRVVQVKSGEELDMRGRCSAGQKMLACLIIRMALAEVFSTKCGILTLDEPTTNLDKVNVARLCYALANLVSVRSSHRSNFQLIVITHDEDFIDKLTSVHKVDYYYSVTRNDRGKSVVTAVYSR